MPRAREGLFFAAGGTVDYNDWYTSTGSFKIHWQGNGVTYTSFAAYQAGTGYDAHGISANPQFTATAGTGGTCYSSGIPVGPQNSPTGCPTPYVISTTASPVIGTGVNTAYGITNPTTDYYGNTIPHGHGSGFNMGADGGYP
jgi:hypothetical protein